MRPGFSQNERKSLGLLSAGTYFLSMVRLLLVFLTLAGAALYAPSLAFAEKTGGGALGEPDLAVLEVAIALEGIDADELRASLSQRLRRPVKAAEHPTPRSGRARLELSFDPTSGTTRFAYHDGESDAPALVVLAKFSGGMAPSSSWLLAQAEAAIHSFGHCEPMMHAPVEILDPWSPSATARAQRWAEVLDPWLGCSPPPSRPAMLTGIPDDFFLLEGEVLDPWSEAAYAERGEALIAPRPGVPARPLSIEKRP